ncbi:unnamed protein product [Caenorhabditis sp. 36 PRJEB53466]|nr:unnamed protein product [Caenorhabditis sp. 36 PRJEB53466]
MKSLLFLLFLCSLSEAATRPAQHVFQEHMLKLQNAVNSGDLAQVRYLMTEGAGHVQLPEYFMEKCQGRQISMEVAYYTKAVAIEGSARVGGDLYHIILRKYSHRQVDQGWKLEQFNYMSSNH